MDIDIEQILSRFKVIPSKSLFPLKKEDFIEWLPKFRCPVCHRRLYWNLQGDKAFCKSKKKDGFFVRAEVLKKYETN